MKDYRTVLFDLDGTLTDSQDGILSSIRSALAYFGIDEPSNANLRRFLGPPLRTSFSEYYGLSAEEAEVAVKKYRETYANEGLYINRVYEGIEEMLIRLKGAGKELIVATSKPVYYAVRIMEHFGIAKYFRFASGCELNGLRDAKADVIAYAMEVGGCDAEGTVMVGDRKHDLLGAAKNGIDAIGVLYGYGSFEELSNHGAIAVAKTPGEVADVILGK